MPDLDLDLMRKSGAILAETLRFLTKEFIRPGISAFDVSKKAEEIIRSHEGAVPAFMGYNGFKDAACVSVNTEVVHGIPKPTTILKEGDIISVDCGVIYEGHFSDACRTVGIAPLEERTYKLLTVTESLNKGIAAAKPGNHIGDISFAVQRHIERNRFKVSLEFVGHGIGKVLHGPPCVPNYGPPGVGELIKPGMCLAIEPVVFDGPPSAYLQDDGWTVESLQGNLSAHFEDTILITEHGPRSLILLVFLHSRWLDAIVAHLLLTMTN